jgi:hypothetical protein
MCPAGEIFLQKARLYLLGDTQGISTYPKILLKRGKALQII